MMGLCVLVIALFLPKQARFSFEYEKGKIWLHKDLVSPYTYAIKKTSEELKKDQEGILGAVNPVYQNNAEIVESELETFATNFEIQWKNSGEEFNEKEGIKKIAIQILEDIYSRGVINRNKKFQHLDSNYNFSLLTDNVLSSLNTLDAFTIAGARKYALARATAIRTLEKKSWLVTLLMDNVEANYIYDERLTNKVEEEALASISPSTGMVQKGELIIATDNMITPEAFQKLESLREVYEQDALIIGDRKFVFAGQFLLVGIIVGLMMVFLYLFRKDIFNDNRKVSLILMIITFMLLLLSWAIKIKIPSVYYIPYCIVPIIIRILFDTRLALNLHLLVVLIAGFFVPNSFEFAFLQVTAGMVAIYSIKNLVKREQIIISAFQIFVTYFLAFAGISFIRAGSVSIETATNFIPFISSVLLCLLAYPLIYLFEKMFNITSEVTLMEITNTNSKVLRELSFKAPGTFQHSLQVANLAEAAIFKIGGNALLVRAGALYHDIGKMDNPQYFIENQNTGTNPHDKLPYEKSAQIIIQHVNKGIEMARHHHIPEVIIDFIRTHHGNTRVDYFYQSFLKNFPEKLVDENIFRYPGPIPFSKETAVLMLADSVEAASRSLKEPNVESINQLVDRIVKYKLDQHQLNDSNITLKDLETIKLIFKSMLIGIYHVRIDYTL